MLIHEKKIIVASPRGFCAGVVRAIETVRNTLQKYGAPVYVLHEIVHNKHVISELQTQGAVFVEGLEDIPSGEICIFSAHGVSLQVEKKAYELGLKTIDATCPLVSSIHRIVENFNRKDFDIIIIGHHNHPEVEGTAGRVDNNVHIIASEEEAEKLHLEKPERCAYVTQTTLSQDDIINIHNILTRKFPQIVSSQSNTCYATQNRQDAVKKLAKLADIVLVVGSKNSSNSNRLREVALKAGVDAYLIDDKNDLEMGWFENTRTIGITAGASAPERLVEGVLDWIRGKWKISLTEMEGKEKKMYFRPADLK
ncbi:MAG: 4-hydroxy-3-methylbut-2-enyl diphosphate reductase [Desulfopila sp.]|jgi:4-hydroxy-3-methylbut-2-enyl diphosphate reductase|nr:4-hydroxy-3-methylbut-2-enyl diphosphate reductase [Desulfopila sp.]